MKNKFYCSQVIIKKLIFLQWKTSATLEFHEIAGYPDNPDISFLTMIFFPAHLTSIAENSSINFMFHILNSEVE